MAIHNDHDQVTATFRPRTLPEALAYRRDTGSRPFLGGTDLMVRYRGYSGTVPRIGGSVLFLDALPELRMITGDGDGTRTGGSGATVNGAAFTTGGITIGAAVTYTEMLERADLPPLLRRAVAEIAAPAIRNRGTMAGNLCNASPAGDTIPPLYIHEAEVALARLSGAGKPEFRTIAVSEFVTGPGRTTLAGDELVTAIHIPSLPEGHHYYRKVGTRKANALSKLSAAGYARIVDGAVVDIRFALGAVAPTVLRLSSAEALLRGRSASPLTEEETKEVLAIAGEVIRPIDDQRSTAEYRKTVALNALREFLDGVFTDKNIQPENGVSDD
jgi:CO/xanthine dehydrogenase FAD-binding subunit